MTGPELAGGNAAGGGMGEPQTVVGLTPGPGAAPCANTGAAATAPISAAQPSVRTNCLRIKRIPQPKHLSLLDLLGDSDERIGVVAGPLRCRAGLDAPPIMGFTPRRLREFAAARELSGLTIRELAAL